MTALTRTRLLNELNDIAVLCAVGAGLPYTLGEAANVLPPEVKKWVVIVSLSSAGILKTTSYVFRILNAIYPDSPLPVVIPPVDPFSGQKPKP